MLYSFFTSITSGLACGFCYSYLFKKSQEQLFDPLKSKPLLAPPRKIIVTSVLFFLGRYALLAATLLFLVYILGVQPVIFLILFLISFLGMMLFNKG